MDRRRQILQHQQQRFHRHASNCDAYTFFNLVTAPELLQCVEYSLPEYWERLFPPTETLSMFLAQAMSADRSCQNAVNDLSFKRSCGGMKPNRIRAGAYCKIRKLIQSLVVGLGALMLVTGERFFSVGFWDKKPEALWSAVIAVLLGFVSCHVASSDKLHSFLRKLKITTQTSYPCEWYSAFSSRPRFVVLHLLDDKRLYGWPIEWPSAPTRGQLSSKTRHGSIAMARNLKPELKSLLSMFQTFNGSNLRKRSDVHDK